MNGFKTLETRNNELFAPYEGRRVVVRVGMKDWDNASWKLWHPAGAADRRRINDLQAERDALGI